MNFLVQSNLIEAICKIGVFIICARVLIHFRPKASYEKYFKMLVSAMILLQIFTPFSRLFDGNGEQNLAERVAWFETELERRREEALQDYAGGEAFLQQMTLKEVRSLMESEQAGDTVEETTENSAGSPGDSEGDIGVEQIGNQEIDRVHIKVGEGGNDNAENRGGNN